MQYFMTPKERIIMVLDLEDAIHDNVPFLNEIMSNVGMTPQELEIAKIKFE